MAMYVTRHGEFATLQEIRAAYLDAPDREKYWLDPFPKKEEPWAPDLLHASEVGGCPRATAYRLLGTPEKPRSAKSKANRRIMFNAGYRFHYLTYSALSWAGLLIGEEVKVQLPEGWSGRCDALFVLDCGSYSHEAIGYDLKTVLPNMLAYHREDTPKLKDVLQLAMYRSLGFTQGMVEYADRAGSNSPEECLIDVTVVDVEARMRALERVRDALPILPPEMEGVCVPHYTRQGQWMVLNEVSYETPWECQYCDYHLTKKEKRTNPNSGRMKEHSWTCSDSTCKPANLPPLKIAEHEGERFVNVRSGYESQLEAWLETKPKLRFPVYEEE